MARFVLFLLLLIPLAVAGDWLLDHPGEMVIFWQDYEISMHTATLALLISVLCLGAVLLALLIYQLVTWPERSRARRRFRTLSRGLKQLTHGVTALALGDEKAATIALKKATAALPNEPLPQLLTAQLLQRQGQQDAARTHLRALLKHEATAQLASRRLIEQHLSRKEWANAIALAEQVRTDTPRDRWVALTLIDLYARERNADAMLALTEGWQWQSPLSKEERHRYAALAHYLSSQESIATQAHQRALRHAVGYAPDFLPALLDYVNALMDADEQRQARKWLLAGWLRAPHHLFIEPILRSIAGHASRTQWRLLKPFVKGEERAEHHLLRAQLALNLHQPQQAKESLEAALALAETKEACTLMAQAEKQLHGEEAANRWLSRAVNAPASESWICQSCGAAHAAWLSHCQHCDAFDSLRYERPEARITSVELTTAA